MAGDYEQSLGPDPSAEVGPPPPGGGPRRSRRERDVLAPGHRRVPIGRRIATIGAGAVFGILLFPLVWPVINRLETNDGSTSPTVAGDGEVPSAGSDVTNPTTTSLVALQAPGSGPYVLASLESGVLTLTGTVPDDGIQSELTAAAAKTFVPGPAPQLTVDAGAGDADWLATVPPALSLLVRATEGTMLVADGQVELSIQVPSPAVAERMQRDIGTATGLPVTVESVEATNLEAPSLEVKGSRSQLSLVGQVPTEEIRTATMAAAVARYGQGNVTNQLIADENVHSALWMYQPEELFDALYVFPEIGITISGETVTGYLRGGYSFDRGSDQALPENDVVTGFVVDLMARDPSLQMFITAHTDSDGEEADNLALSEERARYVYGLFVDAGISDDRIEAVGKGESEPVVAEETSDEDRARNRRIEVTLSSLGGG